jgi:hypothetical protein
VVKALPRAGDVRNKQSLQGAKHAAQKSGAGMVVRGGDRRGADKTSTGGIMMQKIQNARCLRTLAGGAVLVLAVAATADARDKLQINLGPAASVELRTAPEVPPIPLPAEIARNRPTMPPAAYAAAKNAAARQAPGQAKPSGLAPGSIPGVTLFTQVTTITETGGTPSPDIATSAQWVIQVVNDQVVMYNWVTNDYVQKNLLSLFHTAPPSLAWGPRVIYDRYWDRFIALAAGCNPCFSGPVLWLAVSKTGDASGAWWTWQIYAPNSPPGGNDFPQLGMDLNSIIVTYNTFDQGNFFDSRAFAVAKAYLYNGASDVISTLFTGGSCTMTPPYVLDNNATAYVLSFCPGSNQVLVGSFTNTGLSAENLHMWDAGVPVTLSGVPPQALQPGVDAPLDTGDNRFENRSLQAGSGIINTATVNVGGFARAAFYSLDIASPPTLVANRAVFASATSYDWHPSIVANGGSYNGNVFITWMSTDPSNNVNLQLRANGWFGDDPGGPVAGGTTVFTSPRPLTGTGGLNGYYSSVTTYPAAALGCQADGIGVLVGETAGPTAGNWYTHIGIVKHC